MNIVFYDTVNHLLSGCPSYGHICLPGKLASIICVFRVFAIPSVPSLEGFRLLTPHQEVFEDRHYGFLCAAAYISKKKLDIIKELKKRKSQRL